MAEGDIEGQSDRTGNVAQYTTEKINELGGKVVTLSDYGGYIYAEEVINIRA